MRRGAFITPDCLAAGGEKKNGFIDCEASHLCGFLHQPPMLLKDLEQKCGDL